MSLFKNNRSDVHEEQNDSFVISDSEEEILSFSKGSSTLANTKIIEDTDSESENSEDGFTNPNSNKVEIESLNSDEEDLQFINNSHKISIIEYLSDSDCNSNNNTDNKKINRLKRCSIYENSMNSDILENENSSINHLHKKARKKVLYSDSDSDNISADCKKHIIGHNPNSTSNEFEVKSNIEKKNSFSKETSIKNKKEIVLTNDNSIKDLKREQEIDEIIICSSSTSENEIDKEVIILPRKEIGVNNIDFIDAQKKEDLQRDIELTQMQIDKFNKFASTVDIYLLPDKGAKVHEKIKQHENKLFRLKAQLAELSFAHKKLASTEKIQIPKNSEKKKLNCKKDEKKMLNIENTVSEDRNLNEFDLSKIPILPKQSFNTNGLGTQALETLNKEQTLTQQKLEELHGSLTLRPDLNKKECDPSGLKVSLMHHQQQALTWIKWREKQKPRGGILADDMGLGKTLTMIALILSSLHDQKEHSSDESNSSDDDRWLSRNKYKRCYGGTLVICPASLINQWEAEIKNHCKRGLLSTLIFHGNSRNIDIRKLSKYNVVITTYQVLVREASAETAMYKMEWNRVIVDEAHYIRNHKSKASLAVCGLHARYRWAVTGTPIQNKEMDLYAILKFLKCSPFDNLQVWKRWVDNKNDAGMQRLITIMKTLLLRRTKQELQSNGYLNILPDKNLDIIEIDMDHDENLVYQKILLFSQGLFAQFLSQRAEKEHMKELYSGKFDKPFISSNNLKTQFTKAQQVLLEHHKNIEAHEILVLLLRLRQMCCHPALIHKMLDKHDAEMNGLDDEEQRNEDLINKLHNMSVNEDENIEEHVANYKIDKRVAMNLLTKKNPVFDDNRQSSKVRAVINTVEEIIQKGDKLIVVSQWTNFLNVVAKNLKNIKNAKYAMFTGNVVVKDRQAIIDKLNDPCDDVNILLLSLTAGGVGLNLIGANHLLLIDIHWNPQLEAQAQDRIYRFGQHKSVYIYKFICKDSIEERVKNLQEKKLNIANHVLSGTKSISSKLSIQDLKLLFS